MTSNPSASIVCRTGQCRRVVRNAAIAAVLGCSDSMTASAQTPDTLQPTAKTSPIKSVRWTTAPGENAFIYENDIGSTDRSYTNGIQLHQTRLFVPRFAKPFVSSACTADYFQTDSMCGISSVSLSQVMYTPKDLLNPELIPGDRPYAGILTLGMEIEKRKGLRSDAIELKVGVLGPLAKSKDTQSLAHWLLLATEAPRPQGWANQLNTMPVLQGAYRRAAPKFRFESNEWKVDLSDRYEAAAGTYLGRASAGLALRAGFRVPEWGTLVRITQSVATSQRQRDSIAKLVSQEKTKSVGKSREFYIYGFATADTRFVFWNSTIDGGFNDYEWKTNNLISLKRLLGEYSYGVSVGYEHAGATLHIIRRTSEFSTYGGLHRFVNIGGYLRNVREK